MEFLVLRSLRGFLENASRRHSVGGDIRVRYFEHQHRGGPLLRYQTQQSGVSRIPFKSDSLRWYLFGEVSGNIHDDRHITTQDCALAVLRDRFHKRGHRRWSGFAFWVGFWTLLTGRGRDGDNDEDPK